MWYFLAILIWAVCAFATWYAIHERVQFANDHRTSNKVIRFILIFLTWWLIVPAYFGAALAIAVHLEQNKH
jgi:hypothetical protein